MRLLSKRLTRNYDDGPARSARARERRSERIERSSPTPLSPIFSRTPCIPLFSPPPPSLVSRLDARDRRARTFAFIAE